MRKFKLSGDKILLMLGGVGIVAAVAVIVFLISFNFGGNKPEQTETEQSTEQMAPDIDSTDVAEEQAVPDAIGISDEVEASVEQGCRGAVDAFADCFIWGRAQGIGELLPEAVWDAKAQEYGCTREQLLTVISDNLSGNGAGSQLEDGDTIEIQTESVLHISEEDAAAIKKSLVSEHGFSDGSVGEIYAVVMVLERTVDGEVISERDELYCVNIDGQWYLSEKDCLAVYYMLGM